MAVAALLLAATVLSVSRTYAADLTLEDCTNSALASIYGPAFTTALTKCLQTTCEGKTGDDLTLCVGSECSADVDVCNFLSRSSADGKTCCDFFGSQIGMNTHAGSAWASSYCSVDACTPSENMPDHVKCYDVLLANNIQVDANSLTLGEVTDNSTRAQLCSAFNSTNGDACCAHVEKNPSSAVAGEGGFGQVCSYVSAHCDLSDSSTTTPPPANATGNTYSIFRQQSNLTSTNTQIGLAVGFGIVATVLMVGLGVFVLCRRS